MHNHRITMLLANFNIHIITYAAIVVYTSHMHIRYNLHLIASYAITQLLFQLQVNTLLTSACKQA